MAKMYGTGVFSGDLVTALKEIRTDWNAVLAKLDSDSGVAATDYVSACAIATIRIIDTETGGAVDQQSVIKRIKAAIVSINAVNAKLDADNLEKSDYASKYNVSDTIKAYSGVSQGDIVKLLYTIKTNINAIEAYLDADTTVNTTTYASGNPISFTIDSSGC